jgi:hypothetical protein
MTSPRCPDCGASSPEECKAFPHHTCVYNTATKMQVDVQSQRQVDDALVAFYGCDDWKERVCDWYEDDIEVSRASMRAALKAASIRPDPLVRELVEALRPFVAAKPMLNRGRVEVNVSWDDIACARAALQKAEGRHG